MKRMLVVSPTAKAGGAERALARLTRHLPSKCFRPLVALLEPGPLEAWLTAVDCEVVLRRAEDRRTPVEWVHDLVLESKSDLVLSNKWEGQLVGGPAADAAGLPAVWWQQDIARENPDELRAASLPAAAIVCSSDHAVAAQRSFVPDARIEKIHLGVPVAEIAARRGSGALLRRSFGGEASSLVGIVGRLERWKGQEVFLHAASLVAEDQPHVRFAVIGGALLGGEGTYPDDLRRLARELGLADRVRFTGHQDDPYPWFDALDVAVHASRAEPFGLVVVEAMALGKALVATVPGGPAEIVEDGVSGLLVPFGEAELLAAEIIHILGDRVLAARLGEAASRRAWLFSEERMANRFSALLEDVLAVCGRSARS